MEFKRIEKETVILDPQNDMRPRKIRLEVRRDPLTGRQTRIGHFRELKWDRPDIDHLVAGTESWCPFCAERVMTATPAFPENIIAGGRLVSGDKVLFPNIAPYDALGAVATLGSQHYIPMADIEADRIAAGIELACSFFRETSAAGHPESVYHLISWNYMPASGSSLIHPHLQVFATASPPNRLQTELKAAASYCSERGSVYWDDLVDIERQKGNRYLGDIGRTHWLAAFAPLGAVGDVIGIVDDVHTTLELQPEDILDMATGLTRAMAGYDRLGLYNFNVSIFPGRKEDRYMRLHVVFSPRIYFNPSLGTPDAAALRTLFGDSVCMALPEQIAAGLKREFRPNTS
jgi:galactose-1-phosphate uridylyltransferase